jgi:histidinol dehydrogenase
MRIIKLTSFAEKSLLRSRHQRDAEAERVAKEIIEDIRARGDQALTEWTKKLDGVDIAREGMWITRDEMSDARKHADREFLRAIACR